MVIEKQYAFVNENSIFRQLVKFGRFDLLSYSE